MWVYTKMGITQSYFKPGTPNFTRQFILIERGVAPRGCGTCEYTLKWHNSAIFAFRSFKCCLVVDLEVMDKLGEQNLKGVWHLGDVALVSIHLNGNNSVIFAHRSFKVCRF